MHVGEILIENGFIATMGADRRVYRRGSVYIEDDRLVQVGKTVELTCPLRATADPRT